MSRLQILHEKERLHFAIELAINKQCLSDIITIRSDGIEDITKSKLKSHQQ